MEIHLHPIIVHFPVALFLTAAGLEVLSLIFKKESLHQTAWHLFILAVAAAPLAVWTGLQEAEEHNLINHAVFNLHKNFGLLTMWGSLVSLPVILFFKKKNTRWFRTVFVVCAFLISMSVAITAYNGGKMVYEYGIGVEE